MKKKNVFIAVCLAIAGICALCANVFLFTDKQKYGLLMENVEALADSEDFVITCSSGSSGQCYRESCDLRICGEHSYYKCEFTGYMLDQCWEPC